jgi:hypothetical protein
MSLNKTLDRLFDEIRREAKRNPDFANRLDAVLRLHDSRRDVPESVVEEMARPSADDGVYSPARGGSSTGKTNDEGGADAQASNRAAHRPPAKKTRPAPAINPAGFYKREGAEALTAALSGFDLGSLRALVAEHNLDPSGVTATLTRAELAEHIVAQAKRRAERDEKMFDY